VVDVSVDLVSTKGNYSILVVHCCGLVYLWLGYSTDEVDAKSLIVPCVDLFIFGLAIAPTRLTPRV
jgi:hypothetical protein